MSEFEKLLSGLVEETLTDDERRRLAEIVQEDPEARARYLEHCNLHAALAWEHGVLLGVDAVLSSDENADKERVVKAPIRFDRWRRPLAWAAGIALIGGLVWQGAIPLARKSQWQGSDSLGTVVRKAGGELSVPGLGIQLNKGDSLRAGNYALTDGLAQFELENGVQVLVEAPAQFEIRSAQLLALYRGKLSANVPPEGVGFTVETPGAEVVDFGTEFGVEVDDRQRSEVHVFNGEVEVKTREPSVEPVRLTKDQATRVDIDDSEPSGIAVAPERFIRDLNEPVRRYAVEVRRLDPAVYYRMAVSDDGLTLLDRSGNEFHGLIERGEMEGPAFAPGRVGKALRLQGASTKTYARVEDYPKSTDGLLSVVAWVFAESRPTWASIAKNWAPGEVGQFHLGLLQYQGGLQVQVREADGGTVYVEEPTPLPLGEWQHIGFVADGEFVRLFRNGVEVARERYEGLAKPTFKALGIGIKLPGSDPLRQQGSAGYWDGRIDELAVFNRALSSQDIEKLYHSVNTIEEVASK